MRLVPESEADRQEEAAARALEVPSLAPVQAQVLAMQRAAGNAATVQVLARKWSQEEETRKANLASLKAASTKGGTRMGVVTAETAEVMDKPLNGSTLAELPKDAPVRILGSEGVCWIVEHEGKRAYIHGWKATVKQGVPKVTLDQLFTVYPDFAADAKQSGDRMEQAKRYLDLLNEAFELFNYDTLEAQSAFLAHGWAESDQFRQLTESVGASQRWIEDPTAVRLDEGYLNKQYPEGSGNRASINPGGKWEYLGRGATQVTHSYNYKRACDVMDLQAELYEKAGNPTAAARLRGAAAAIRKDPREAARPTNTFLFSAAAGKMANLDRPARVYGKQVRSRDYNAGAVTGGHKDNQATGKKAAYERALDSLF